MNNLIEELLEDSEYKQKLQDVEDEYLVEQVEEREVVEPGEQLKRRLYTDRQDKSVIDLVSGIKRGDIILDPEFQRNFVWSDKNQSLFIESLLLRIPIPTIFMAETEEGKWEVIDGLQRLTTLYRYVEELDEKHEPVVEGVYLTGLETLPHLNGKRYSELTDTVQKILANAVLQCVIVSNDSSPDIKYDIFSRINIGAVSLNQQELLNVIFRGSLLRRLNEIANSQFVSILDERRAASLQRRMNGTHLLCRALMMDSLLDENFKVKGDVEGVSGASVNMSSVLSWFLSENRESEDLCERVEKSLPFLKSTFGDKVFVSPYSADSSTRLNNLFAEVQLVTAMRLSSLENAADPNEVQSLYSDYFLREKFNEQEIFQRQTNRIDRIEQRYQWLNAFLSQSR